MDWQNLMFRVSVGCMRLETENPYRVPVVSNQSCKGDHSSLLHPVERSAPCSVQITTFGVRCMIKESFLAHGLLMHMTISRGQAVHTILTRI
jgi:hypothetical protein